MPWVTRGLREGIVTTRYPARPDGYGEGWMGTVGVVGEPEAGSPGELEQLCPTGAISARGGQVRLDRGRCILCRRCVDARPDLFCFDSSVEVASMRRSGLVVPPVDQTDAGLALARADLARRVRCLRRSVHVRHVDAGSDGSDEWEVAALTNPVYDVHRLGIFISASPRHADVLLVTGAGTAGMLGPLRRTLEAMPDPKVVVAAGTDAASGGILAGSYASHGGIGDLVPVDVWVPGSPPSPFSLLHGLLLAVGLISEAEG